VPEAARSGRSPLVVLFLTVFIDLMGFGIVIPLLPVYAREHLDASYFAAGALVAVYSLMQLIFAPVWGRSSDRFGRRPILLVSLAGSAASYILLAGAWSLPILFVARALAGIAGSNISVAQAYIADVTTGADRTRGMGLIGAAFALGMVVGPAIGGTLSLLGPRLPYVFAALLCLLNLAMAAYRIPETLPPSARRIREFRHPLALSSLRAAMTRPGAATMFGVFFLVTLGFAVLEGTFSLVAADFYGSNAHVDPERVKLWVGGLWTYMGVMAAVVQGWLVGRLARRVPERALVLVGTMVLGIGFACVPFARATSFLLLALGLVIAGQGLASPSLASLISKTAGAGEHGDVLGVSQSFSAAARVLGPAGGALILGRAGAGGTYLGAAACAVGAFGLTALGGRAAGHRQVEAIPLRRSG
jgi:multidrug resistance protein